MKTEQRYDPALPRHVADLIQKYGLQTVIDELASYCEVEWIQAEKRCEPGGGFWRNASIALFQVVEFLETQE
ncbi:MAG: hypothetical protein N3E45_01785 [Oscillatoriaceae bacterium SKW80]|nr:hypothetical protein [Oscillatoriaceae bacterium SKYG93]MCX8119558.1 hypothetical protein [Oscillatoriaceae bacterium SKW80]MDW8455025.1 hypothetical protein [Oscillatoriaceae cyanobacterium SKYGB_i_bin93]HIK28198.1 hypothetical protein [Oscillatoriaceae cyanobacterium M7585_C2015_266]